jgi:hypothetical protein
MSLAGYGSCEEASAPPASQADCASSQTCFQHGQCTFRRATGTCVVGSDADCARSNVCQKQNRCKKVGETCGAER